MRRLIVVAASLAFFSAGWCFGSQHATKPGGSAWKEVQESERQMYVVRFMHGYILAWIIPLATETDIIIASLRCTANLQYSNYSDLVSFCASLTAYSGSAPTV